MPFVVKFTIQSDTHYLAPLRQLMASIGRVLGKKRFPKRAQTACTLALIEAVDNAIFHAHERTKELPIGIEITVGKGLVRMIVADRGPGLDHPPITAPELVSTHGRGLFMMDKLMRSVESRKTKGGHEMILTYQI